MSAQQPPGSLILHAQCIMSADMISLPFNNFSKEHVIGIAALLSTMALACLSIACFASFPAFFTAVFAILGILLLNRLAQLLLLCPSHIEIDPGKGTLRLFSKLPWKPEAREYPLSAFSYCTSRHTALRWWVISQDIFLGGADGEVLIAMFEVREFDPKGTKEAVAFIQLLTQTIPVKEL